MNDFKKLLLCLWLMIGDWWLIQYIDVGLRQVWEQDRDNHLNCIVPAATLQTIQHIIIIRPAVLHQDCLDPELNNPEAWMRDEREYHDNATVLSGTDLIIDYSLILQIFYLSILILIS